MKPFIFILLVTAVTLIGTGCEHAHPGGYSAPNKGAESNSFNEEGYSKMDSSVEKALAGDTTKRVYKL